MRKTTIALLFLSLGVALPVAAEGAASPPSADAYARLQRLGLLNAPAAPAPSPSSTPGAAAATPINQTYATLQRLGLLDAQPATTTAPPPAPPPLQGAEPIPVKTPDPAAPPPSLGASSAPAPTSVAAGLLRRLGLKKETAIAAHTAPTAVPAAQEVAGTAQTTPSVVTPEPTSVASTALSSAPARPGFAGGLLQRLGLLKAEPAPEKQPTPAATPAPQQVAAATQASTPAAPAAYSPVSKAYEMLRAKGLLPGGPANIAKSNRNARRPGAERVLVDKSERKLFLFKDGRPYREYRISLGGVPNGPKQRAGDLKTPEGVYTLDWRNPRSRFYKSIHISYPNEQDRQRAEQQGVDPGGHIMIHGEHYLPSLQRTLRRATTPKDWTEGCIAMNNEHIDEIWKEVSDGTPIEIRP